MAAKPGDLSPTALYTSQVWAGGGLSHAHLFASPDATRVFDATNAALAAARMFNHRLAPLRHSLLHRHTMIDHLLRESGYRHVIELAAGFLDGAPPQRATRAVTYTEPTCRSSSSASASSSSAPTRVARCSRGRGCASSRVTSTP